MRCFFRAEYDGAAFSGWQSQKNATSVQSVIESAFSTVLRVPVKITGAGRTDAGVHASGQGVHADLPENVNTDKLCVSVNAVLPQTVAIRDIVPVPSSFHARFSAVERTYEYIIVSAKSPLLYKRACVVTRDIDWQMVKTQIPHLVGRHDFAAFCASNSGVRTTICTVKCAEIKKRGRLRVFTISADRFLYHMVRSIAGTLIDIGRGAVTSSINEIIQSRDRRMAGETAPAWGLTLTSVKYSEVRAK
jgi:tRNA pseudouridine38-40 synthase